MSWTGSGRRSSVRSTSGTCLCGWVAMSHRALRIHGASTKMPVGFMYERPDTQASHSTSLTPSYPMRDSMNGKSQMCKKNEISIEKQPPSFITV